MNTVTISCERYEELIKKELAYEVRRAEVQQSSYKSATDVILFGIEPAKKDDDF